MTRPTPVAVAAVVALGLLAAPSSAAATTRQPSAPSPRVQRLVGDRLAVGSATSAQPTPATASSVGCVPPDVVGLADRIEVSWPTIGGMTGNPASYTLTRRSYSSSAVLTRTFGPTTHAYTDRSVSPDDIYTYELQEKTDTGETSATGCHAGDTVGQPDLIVSSAPAGSSTFRLVARSDYSNTGSPFAAPDATEIMPAFSPSGRLLAAAMNDGTSWDVVVRAANGTDQPTGVADDPALDELEPAWSPDGRRLAYAARPAGQNVAPHIEVLDLATGVVDVWDGVPASHPSFSADSRVVVATNLASATAPLLTLNLTTGATGTVPGTQGGYDPNVSRTGLIAYADDQTSPGTVRLRRTSFAGASNTILASETSTDDLWSPRFTPDSATVYWLTVRNSRDSLRSVSAKGGTPVDFPAMNGPFTVSSVDGFDVRKPPRTDTSDLDGDGLGDLLTRDSTGVLWLQPTRFSRQTPTMATRVRVGSGWNAYNGITAAGDITDDGRPDLIAKDSSGGLYVWPRTSSGWGARQKIGSGFASYTLVATGDIDGDGLADLVARYSNGDMYAWSGTGLAVTGTPAFVGKRRFATRWGGLSLLTGPGDLNSDGFADLVGRDSTGALWLFRGNGRGSFPTHVKIGSGWSKVNALVGVGDGGLGTPSDLVGRLTTGDLWLWAGSGYGRFGGQFKVGSGWGGYTAITG